MSLIWFINMFIMIALVAITIVSSETAVIQPLKLIFCRV